MVKMRAFIQSISGLRVSFITEKKKITLPTHSSWIDVCLQNIKNEVILEVHKGEIVKVVRYDWNNPDHRDNKIIGNE